MASFLSVAPDKVLDSIFVFCDYGELFASSHVCSAWRRRTGNSIMWRRVAEADLDRARSTEYQVVATPVRKRAGLSSSFNTSHLYTVEVRTRHRQRDAGESAYDGGSGGHGYGRSTSVPSYAQNLQMYTFGAEPTSAFAASVSGAYGDGNQLERNPSSTCFTTLGSTAQVRRVCVRYIQLLRLTAGDTVAAALSQANSKAAASSPFTPGSGSESDDDDIRSLPLWEDGSIVRPGVLICDPHDPCSFCYYAATLCRPWCTVLMDHFIIDDALLIDFIEHSRDGDGTAAAACIDLAFRVEEPPVVRNDPRDPSHLVKPAQPVSIRIGVIEASQLGAYRRGLQHVIRGMTFYSPADAANTEKSTDDSDDVYGDAGNESGVDTTAQDYAWGALDAGSGSGARRGYNGGVSWSYTGGGGGQAAHRGDDDPNSAAAAEAEVTAWLRASVQESMQTPQSKASAASASSAAAAAAAPSKPTEFWAQAPDTRARRATAAEVPDDHGDCAFALGDTPGSFGYDTEGAYISEASSYPLGAPLQKDDVVHLQFFPNEDVMVVTRNRERLGTLVADAFSEHQRWCVAVSLQNCGVRFIPPRLN